MFNLCLLFCLVKGGDVQMLLRCEKSIGVNYQVLKYITPRNTNMTLEKKTFEDVPRIKNGDVPLSC